VDDPEAYNLQPGLLDEQGKEVFGVSMYHSLHCLVSIPSNSKIGPRLLIQYGMKKMIHHDYWRLLSSPDSPTPDDAVIDHIGHCFDYVRQSIQCSADMTISWANLTEPERPHIDGWDIPHRQCRDWVSIVLIKIYSI
jgi:Mycotoxin biosynthesis protein UstYa